THLGTPAFLHLEARRYPGGGVLEQARIGAGQALELLAQVFHGMQRGMLWWFAALPDFGQAGGGQASETGAQLELRFLAVSGPGAQLVEPRIEVACLHLAAVHLLGRHGLAADPLQLIGPLAPGRLELTELLGALPQRRLDEPLQRLVALFLA